MFRASLFFSVALAALWLSASPARADTPPPAATSAVPTTAPSQPSEAVPAPPPAPELNRVYASLSPFHLAAPIVEGQVEIRANPRVGVAVLGGGGSMKASGFKFTVWEVGGQFVGYPVGDFDHGMQLGLEVLYAHVSTNDTGANGVTLSGVGSGLGVGPFIGYKLATKVGFTFNIQGGVEYMAVRADATDGTRSSGTNQSAFIPLANLNVGWSF